VEIRGRCGVARWQKCDEVGRKSSGLAGVSELFAGQMCQTTSTNHVHQKTLFFGLPLAFGGPSRVQGIGMLFFFLYDSFMA